MRPSRSECRNNHTELFHLVQLNLYAFMHGCGTLEMWMDGRLCIRIQGNVVCHGKVTVCTDKCLAELLGPLMYYVFILWRHKI